MKAIAMRCTQQQFDKIKDKLSGYNLNEVNNLKDSHYLVNNFWGEFGHFNNLDKSAKGQYCRTVFEEWDEDVFLEYCGIETFPKDWYIEATKENFSVLSDWILSQPGVWGKYFEVGHLLLSRHVSDNSYYYNGSFEIFKCDRSFTHYKSITFEQFKKHVLKQNTMGQKLTVPITEVVKIHDVACSGWKKTIADYLKRVDVNLNITFTQGEVDEMFKAADNDQTVVLEGVFGKKVQVIDYGKITTGSVVMVGSSGEEIINTNTGVDFGKPVTVVFFKTPHHIDSDGGVDRNGRYNSYCTFIQNGKVVSFAANTKIDYITEVIVY